MYIKCYNCCYHIRPNDVKLIGINRSGYPYRESLYIKTIDDEIIQILSDLSYIEVDKIYDCFIDTYLQAVKQELEIGVEQFIYMKDVVDKVEEMKMGE